MDATSKKMESTSEQIDVNALRLFLLCFKYLKHMKKNTSTMFPTWVKVHLFEFWNWQKHHSLFINQFGKDINIDEVPQKTFLITIFGIT